MLRHFIAQPPRFGSYKNPNKTTVKESPYFYWWLALTLNDEYSELCARLQNGSVKAANELEQQMLAVYEDFGDVRYDGDRYVAFATWWTAKVGVYKNGSKILRGADLFAESQDTSVHYVNDEEHALNIVNDEAYLLVALPKVNDKKVVMRTLELMVNKHFSTLQGADARNPKFSTAKYKLSSEVRTGKLDKGFKLYELKQKAERDGQRISHNALIDLARIDIGQRNFEIDAWEKLRGNSEQVRRHLRSTESMVSNAAIGMFP